jgi:regulator of sigma E protease
MVKTKLDEVTTILDNNKGKTISATVLRIRKETQIPVTVDKEGMLGVGLGRLSTPTLKDWDTSR